MPTPGFVTATFCGRNSPRIAPGLCTKRPARSLASRAVVTASAVPMRIGHGFDLHRLESGLPLILGGVTLEHDKGCAGHSDGDAVYHCVVDAVLGALSLPDIGQLFPDTDPRFKDCPSHVFMTAAQERMFEEGYRIGNVDVTIILERPKLSPHKEKIRANIANLLSTELENVNVKAKTHEKVDAVGENRAVSVHAVALLKPAAEASNDSVESASAVSVGGTLVGEAVTTDLLRAVGDRASRIAGMTASAGSDALATDTVPSAVLERLFHTISSRKTADPQSSWTAKLFSKGRPKIAQKVGEEAVEVVIAASAGQEADNEAVISESADLLYHLMVLWADMGIEPSEVWRELQSREGTSGVSEKLSRSTA